MTPDSACRRGSGAAALSRWAVKAHHFKLLRQEKAQNNFKMNHMRNTSSFGFKKGKTS